MLGHLHEVLRAGLWAALRPGGGKTLDPEASGMGGQGGGWLGLADGCYRRCNVSVLDLSATVKGGAGCLVGIGRWTETMCCIPDFPVIPSYERNS
jgi:hypothetical protein